MTTQFERYYEQNERLHGHEDEPPVPNNRRHATAGGYVLEWAERYATARPSVVLDIGCGALTLLRGLGDHFERRVGVDVAPHRVWSRYPAIEPHVHNVDEGPLPFADASFDFITMLMVLEHVFNPFHALAEIRRVCKPTGVAVIQVPNLAGLRHRVALLGGRLPVTSARFTFAEEAWDGYHLHNFTLPSLRWLLLREGLHPVHWRSSGDLPWLKTMKPGFFGSDLIVLCRPGERVTVDPDF